MNAGEGGFLSFPHLFLHSFYRAKTKEKQIVGSFLPKEIYFLLRPPQRYRHFQRWSSRAMSTCIFKHLWSEFPNWFFAVCFYGFLAFLWSSNHHFNVIKYLLYLQINN